VQAELLDVNADMLVGVVFPGWSLEAAAAALPRQNGGAHKNKGNEEKRGRQRRREEIVCNLD
jgi:hypothetical protein